MPPLLFMGEEWGSTKPFPFFCDFRGALAEAVRQGRREEFKSAYAGPDDDIPDPLDEETFRSAVLDWRTRETPRGRQWTAHTRGLLAIRAKEIAPRLAQSAFSSARWSKMC